MNRNEKSVLKRRATLRLRAKLYGATVHQQRQAGLSWREVGRRMPTGKLVWGPEGLTHVGVSENTAKRIYSVWRQLTGVQEVSRTQARIEEAKRLRDQGLTSKQVGSVMGVSAATVRSWWRR